MRGAVSRSLVTFSFLPILLKSGALGNKTRIEVLRLFSWRVSCLVQLLRNCIPCPYYHLYKALLGMVEFSLEETHPTFCLCYLMPCLELSGRERKGPQYSMWKWSPVCSFLALCVWRTPAWDNPLHLHNTAEKKPPATATTKGSSYPVQE